MTITHPTRKIDIIDEKLIIAGTGAVGLSQRFSSTVEKLFASPALKGSAIEWCKLMAAAGITDFGQTGIRPGGFGALAGFVHQGVPHLCEFAVADLQPELKNKRIWYVSMGSGQNLADPYLALMRMAFWRDGPPTLQSGIFASAWVMQHAIEAAPGLIRAPIDIAIISADDRKARLLNQDELDEHLSMVAKSMDHFRAFEERFKNTADAPDLPEPRGE